MRDIQKMCLSLTKKVIVLNFDGAPSVDKATYVAGILNMQSLGFMPDKELADKLQTLPTSIFISTIEDIQNALIEMNGSRVNMAPMYPDFPEIMMSLSDEQLFYDAIAHYFTMDVWEARFQQRLKLNTESLLKLNTIGLCSEEELMTYVYKLANSSVSLSESQREYLTSLLCRYYDKLDENIFNMTNKENMVYTIYELYDFLNHEKLATKLAVKHIKTSTDVLRLAMMFLGGDHTLASHKHDFKSIKRKQRRFILSLLDTVAIRTNQALEDAATYQGLWVIVGEMLHPGDYRSKYQNAYVFFDMIRNGKVRSWYSKLEKAYESKNLNSVLGLLQTRPGEFARSLERAMRLAMDTNESSMEVINAFIAIADKVSPTILLQIHAYFINKIGKETTVRTFLPKGNMAKVYTLEDTREPIPAIYCIYVANACYQGLHAQFSKKDKLGKVYIDPAIKGYAIPLKQRNASKQLYSMARGSRISLPEEVEVLRMYQWWKGRVDVDLTAMFIDKDYNKTSRSISFRNFRDKEIGCVHSGDIRSAHNGAAEFIDISLDKIRETNTRYVVLTVNSFSRVEFCNLEECFAGMMALTKEQAEKDKTFDPAKSIVRSDIASDTMMCTPMLYDVQTHELIWLDAAVMGDFSTSIYVENHQNSYRNVIMGLVEAGYPQLEFLFMLHCQAREAEIVDTPEEADIIFSLDKGITPFCVAEINSNWL